MFLAGIRTVAVVEDTAIASPFLCHALGLCYYLITHMHGGIKQHLFAIKKLSGVNSKKFLLI